MLADASSFKGVVAIATHRISHELANCREHAGNGIGIEVRQAWA